MGDLGEPPGSVVAVDGPHAVGERLANEAPADRVILVARLARLVFDRQETPGFVVGIADLPPVGIAQTGHIPLVVIGVANRVEPWRVDRGKTARLVVAVDGRTARIAHADPVAGGVVGERDGRAVRVADAQELALCVIVVVQDRAVRTDPTLEATVRSAALEVAVPGSLEDANPHSDRASRGGIVGSRKNEIPFSSLSQTPCVRSKPDLKADRARHL